VMVSLVIGVRASPAVATEYRANQLRKNPEPIQVHARTGSAELLTTQCLNAAD
jgi:hypothetical protein